MAYIDQPKSLELMKTDDERNRMSKEFKLQQLKASAYQLWLHRLTNLLKNRNSKR